MQCLTGSQCQVACRLELRCASFPNQDIFHDQKLEIRAVEYVERVCWKVNLGKFGE
ncbi:Unannotated [Lentimonas sp. CC19]|nr:Unannotated [Lentimonas sp. CC19]